MALYQNKYRIETLRLSHYDYTSPGEYFVTICTKDRICYFGKIVGGEIRLSPAGLIVEEEWRRTEQVRKNVTVDAFVIMPNHIHGIIVIEESFGETTGSVVSKGIAAGPVVSTAETTHRVVSTRNKPILKPNSIGSIIGQFKSVSTKRIHAAGFRDFGWQPRYYDHVVRDERDLERIREYIVKNPAQWESEDEFPSSL